MICQLQTEATQENGSAALFTLQMRLSYTMYCKEGLTASNSSQLPTKASFPENSSPALPLSRLPSPLHHLKQWGTNPQSIWINLHTHTVRYLSVVSRGSRSPASRRTCCGVEEFFWSLFLSLSSVLYCWWECCSCECRLCLQHMEGSVGLWRWTTVTCHSCNFGLSFMHNWDVLRRRYILCIFSLFGEEHDMVVAYMSMRYTFTHRVRNSSLTLSEEVGVWPNVLVSHGLFPWRDTNILFPCQ